MNLNQKTINRPVKVQGKGLHTGTKTAVELFPGDPSSGIRFQLMDHPQQPIFPAVADHVSTTSRSTTLAYGDHNIHTVEHLLAALAGCKIDNILIRVYGPEIPILDGSASRFCELISEAGILEQEAAKDFLAITESISYSHGGSEYLIEPADRFSLEVEIDYPEPVGVQTAVFSDAIDFKCEIAPNRTFCFFEELETLHKAGLIKGGDLSNAIVFCNNTVTQKDLDQLSHLFHHPHASPKEGVIAEKPLHFPNEAARHKLLDLLGDLALLGQPITGKLTAKKPGHSSNVAFVQKVIESMTATLNSGS